MLKSNPKTQRLRVPGRVTRQIASGLCSHPLTTSTKPPGASRHLWAAAAVRRVFPEKKTANKQLSSSGNVQLSTSGIERDLLRRSVSLPAPGQSCAAPVTRCEEPAPSRPTPGPARPCPPPLRRSTASCRPDLPQENGLRGVKCDYRPGDFANQHP